MWFAIPNEGPALLYGEKQWVCGCLSQLGGCAWKSLSGTLSSSHPWDKGLQAEHKEDVGPTCLSLQDPSYSPGEHLVTSLQDILGRISHLIYVCSESTSGFRRSDKDAFKPSGSDTQLKAWKLGSFSMSTWQTSDKDSWQTNWRVEWNGLRWKKKLKSGWCSSLCISE